MKWLQKNIGDFPGGPVVKNEPCNAEDTGSIPGLGRFHIPGSNYAHRSQLLNPMRPRAHDLQQEKPLQREAHLLQRKPAHSNRDPVQP